MNNELRILAIDPGNSESAYVLLDRVKILDFGKIDNDSLLEKIHDFYYWYPDTITIIEMVASYGMAVGKTVFDTCVWIGRFYQAIDSKYNYTPELLYRKDVKMNLCNSMRAKDSNIIQALVDRFADTSSHGKHGKGTTKNQGYFYGFSKDVWQAYAVGVTYYDMNYKQVINK